MFLDSVESGEIRVTVGGEVCDEIRVEPDMVSLFCSNFSS